MGMDEARVELIRPVDTVCTVYTCIDRINPSHPPNNLPPSSRMDVRLRTFAVWLTIRIRTYSVNCSPHLLLLLLLLFPCIVYTVHDRNLWWFRPVMFSQYLPVLTNSCRMADTHTHTRAHIVDKRTPKHTHIPHDLNCTSGDTHTHTLTLVCDLNMLVVHTHTHRRLVL